MYYFIAAALVCGKSLLINNTKYPWNKHDLNTLNTAKKRCGEIYKDAPCVRLFTKKGKQDYSVICGKGQEDAKNNQFSN